MDEGLPLHKIPKLMSEKLLEKNVYLQENGWERPTTESKSSAE